MNPSTPDTETGHWMHYPYIPDWGDRRWFTFPDADGCRPDLGVNAYSVKGFLRGLATRRIYAFMTIFVDMRVLRNWLRAGFYTFALFDCGRRRHGTYTDIDFPKLIRLRHRRKLEAAPDHLSLRYQAPAGTSSWEARRESNGALRPFGWNIDLHGLDQHGARMALELEMDATRPPAPLGGRELGGEVPFLGAQQTYSYFQTGLSMRGRITWNGTEEEVEGDTGWIDRQWAGDNFLSAQRRQSARYRKERRVMQFENGCDMSCMHQYDRHCYNAAVPWTGITAQGPEPGFELRSTNRVELVLPEFIRSPDNVRAMRAGGPRYFPYRYQLRVPEWEMDVRAEPLIDAPTHRSPNECWAGPVRLSGVLFGAPVRGLGFDERDQPWLRPFEIAEALKLTAEQLAGVDDATRRLLAYRAWEIQALALRGDRRPAAARLRRQVEPIVRALPETVRGRVAALAQDLLDVLEGKIPR